MAPNLLGERLDGILHDTISEQSEPMLVVDPTERTVESLVEVVSEMESTPTVRVLAHESVYKQVFEDFIVASNAADHVDQERFELRVIDERAENTLLITDDEVVALVDAGNMMGALSGEDAEFVDATSERYEDRWESADTYELRTPPLTSVRDQLDEDLDTDIEQDFSGMLNSLETARGDGDGLDEVTLSLLAAAKNEALLYDISRWGEDVGVASKATFSRTKSKLEDAGLIDTEKVPIDVGRPRLRLKLADDRLENAGPDQLATAAQSILN
jgi:hypothetical protein